MTSSNSRTKTQKRLDNLPKSGARAFWPARKEMSLYEKCHKSKQGLGIKFSVLMSQFVATGSQNLIPQFCRFKHTKLVEIRLPLGKVPDPS